MKVKDYWANIIKNINLSSSNQGMQIFNSNQFNFERGRIYVVIEDAVFSVFSKYFIV